MATKTIILTQYGTWNLPSDWNDADNSIEMYGSGNDGHTTGSTTQSGTGGGGGGYVKAVNVPLKSLDLSGYVTSKAFNTTGTTGGLWSGDIGSGTISTLVKGGGGYSGATGGTGGSPRCQINGVNYATIAYSGGNGANGRVSSSGAGGGGGGGAGPNGAGGNGASNTLTSIGSGGGGSNGGGNGSGQTGGSYGGYGYIGGDGGAASRNGQPGNSSAINQSISVLGTTAYVNHSLTTNASYDYIQWSLYGGGTTTNSVAANQVINLYYTISLTQSTYVFWDMSVFSEAGYDFGYLIIDGTQLVKISGVSVSNSSNTTLSAGTHILNFRYTKDGSKTVSNDIVAGSIYFPAGSIGFTGISLAGSGGGGSGDGTNTPLGGVGGSYGGGGGGSGSSTSSYGGAGGSGLIIIQYTPVVPVVTNGNFFTFF